MSFWVDILNRSPGKLLLRHKATWYWDYSEYEIYHGSNKHDAEMLFFIWIAYGHKQGIDHAQALLISPMSPGIHCKVAAALKMVPDAVYLS